MSKAKLKKELEKMSKNQMMDLVLDIYEKVPSAKDLLDVFVSFDVEKLIEKHKKQIYRYIMPNSKFETRETEARKLIRTIRKTNIDELIIELELYYIECCINFINDFGYADENYIVAMEKMLESADDRIREKGFRSEYDGRVNEIKRKGSEYGIFEY